MYGPSGPGLPIPAARLDPWPGRCAIFPISPLNYTGTMRPQRASRFAAMPAFPAAVFLVTLATAVLATELARKGHDASAVARSERPDADHYLANHVGGHVDHHVLYFGTDADAVTRMRAAQVIFLGNSRIMFALRPEALRPFFAAAGLPYYVMGFGFSEADRFPLAIIRKFDLHPALVVVNADGFFGGGLSPWAEVVNRDSAFAARKLQLEAEAAHEARRGVERLLPNWLQRFGLPGLGLRRGFIAYRSRQDGTWEVSPWPEATLGFVDPPPDGPALERGEVNAARAFKAELDARGSRLVLTRVPSPEPMPGAGPARFATLLDVPLVIPEVAALTTHDHSHLSQGSAHDWSRALVQALTPYLQRFDADGPAGR